MLASMVSAAGKVVNCGEIATILSNAASGSTVEFGASVKVDLAQTSKIAPVAKLTGTVDLCKVSEAGKADELYILDTEKTQTDNFVLTKVNFSSEEITLAEGTTYAKLNPADPICADATLKNFFIGALQTGTTDIVPKPFLFTCDANDNASALKAVFVDKVNAAPKSSSLHPERSPESQS